MKEKKNCKIVQDLLPNYIENLTNDETNNFIEEHLRECNECQKVFENMRNDLNIKSEKIDRREVNYIQKFSNKMKTLKFILLILIIIYIAVVGRRIFIMFSLSEKAKENQIYNNYYAELYSYQGESLTITKSYNKGEDYLTTITRSVNGNQVQKITYYKQGIEQLVFTEIDGKKYIQNAENMVGGKILPVTYVSDGLFANLQFAFITGIDSTYCDGKDCYVIKGKSYERYIDKETGFAVRSIDKSNKEFSGQTDTVVDYKYEFNAVKDSDIVKPEID